jgi:hypothetical protein
VGADVDDGSGRTVAVKTDWNGEVVYDKNHNPVLELQADETDMGEAAWAELGSCSPEGQDGGGLQDIFGKDGMASEIKEGKWDNTADEETEDVKLSPPPESQKGTDLEDQFGIQEGAVSNVKRVAGAMDVAEKLYHCSALADYYADAMRAWNFLTATTPPSANPGARKESAS